MPDNASCPAFPYGRFNGTVSNFSLFPTTTPNAASSGGLNANYSPDSGITSLYPNTSRFTKQEIYNIYAKAKTNHLNR